jgi:polar amino acid transport system permease protein
MDYSQILAQAWQFVIGTGQTLLLTLLSMCIGTLFGLLIALGRISNSGLLQKTTWVYIWVFRGTPLLLQIMIIYLISTGDSAFMAASVALVLNTAAYLAEIFRAGILSIDTGQFEASKALGMTKRQTMLYVIIPQTYRRIIPPYANEFIMILKDTSLVSVIGLTELYRVAKTFASRTFDWRYLLIAAAIYLVMTSIATQTFAKLEKRFSIFV